MMVVVLTWPNRLLILVVTAMYECYCASYDDINVSFMGVLLYVEHVWCLL